MVLPRHLDLASLRPPTATRRPTLDPEWLKWLDWRRMSDTVRQPQRVANNVRQDDRR